MIIDASNLHNYEKDFFGRAYPWYRGFLLAIIGITLIGSISAFYIGFADNINFFAVGMIVLMTILAAICLRLLYLGVKKLLSFDWSKIAESLKTAILGLVAICGFLFLCYMMFHDCSGHSHSDLDHIHYERYHR